MPLHDILLAMILLVLVVDLREAVARCLGTPPPPGHFPTYCTVNLYEQVLVYSIRPRRRFGAISLLGTIASRRFGIETIRLLPIPRVVVHALHVTYLPDQITVYIYATRTINKFCVAGHH